MIEPFLYTARPARIAFGNGAVDQAAATLDAIGARRALVLSTPRQRAEAEALAARLGPRAAGVFAEAAMHTPVEVTERAVAALQAAGAECTVALGGGSTTGLGKAIAWRTDARQLVIPTTYAGSEVTPILGQTEGGAKTTLTDPKVLPEAVIYDPELTVGLPVAISVASGLNAIAHAAEGLYARDRNPVTTLMAREGLRALAAALPRIVEAPRHLSARGEALYGAWLCGTVLGSVGMALHHKLCHVLGGSYGLPHAETHAVVLPHAIAFNARAVPDLLAPVAEVLGGGSPGGALWDLAKRLGAPSRLADLGLAESDLDGAAEIAAKNPYWNPAPVDRAGLRALIGAAWAGERPQA
jgi:maleylacetate reductase